jgi:hypothetical protein
MRWVLLLSIAIAAAAGCGSNTKNQCPGSVARSCLNGQVCSFDRKRGCQVCECRPWDQTPTGHDPDDPNPPVPVHD